MSSPGHAECGKKAKLPRDGLPPVPLSCIVLNPVTLLFRSIVKPPWLLGESTSATAFAIPLGRQSNAFSKPKTLAHTVWKRRASKYVTLVVNIYSGTCDNRQTSIGAPNKWINVLQDISHILCRYTNGKKSKMEGALYLFANHPHEILVLL
jgi:hypothetical protein